jgi:hypothetical protein
VFDINDIVEIVWINKMSIDKVNKVYISTTDVNITILNESFRGIAILYNMNARHLRNVISTSVSCFVLGLLTC